MIDECWNVVEILEGIYGDVWDKYNAPTPDTPECTCTPRDELQCAAHPVGTSDELPC
jgi:hypothetical protein